MRRKRWNIINELIDYIHEDDTLSQGAGGYLKRVGYAGHLGYKCWLFKYKTTYVVLLDVGNGHCAFDMPATLFDVIIVWVRKKLHL